jgi:GWxTD domain-containing protein
MTPKGPAKVVRFSFEEGRPVYRKLGLAFLLFAVMLGPAAARAADDAVLTTFLEAKTLYKAKRYDDAESAVRRLGELLAAPEFASVRPKVLPAYYFYGAAVAYERHDEERAKQSLREYFALVPNAALDKGAYSKRFSLFFEVEKQKAAERAEGAKGPAGPQAIGGDVLPSYATFVPEAGFIPIVDGSAEWVDSPVRFLLSEGERRSYRSLANDDLRRQFVSDFWRKLDPRPETPLNELQEEFYRRVQYADLNFSTEKTRGSLSEEGQVFLVLGPPSYTGRMIVRDSTDLMGFMNATVVETVPYKGTFVRVRTSRGETSDVPTVKDGYEDIWYYRGERIPKGIPFNELKFEFLTKTGYGTAVLQKDPRLLDALDRAVKSLRGQI